jgi:hypothetical protein
LALEFPRRAQLASPREQPAAQARLARNLLGASHPRSPPRLPVEDRLARQPHQPAESRRVHTRRQLGRTLRHRTNVRLRPHRLATSAVEESGHGQQNPRAADLKRSAAQQPDPKKLNPRGAGLNFRENLLRQPENLLLTQQILMREPVKGIKSDLTGNQKGAKRILRPQTTDPENSANRSRFSLNLTSS